MNTNLIIPGAFAIHGLAMLAMALGLPWTIRGGKEEWLGASWLLGDGVVAVVVGVMVWLGAGGAYAAAAVGFWAGTVWWPTAAWVGAVSTLAAVGLWARSVPSGAYAGAALAAGTIVYLILL